MDGIRRNPPVPDIFDYSLTKGRDIFALARQCSAGVIRGMETVFYELLQQGIPMDLDAPTVTGETWRRRLADTANLPASGVAENPIILSVPRRPFSGVDVMQGNFFETAVIKISGMTSEQIADFDDQVGVVLFYENEEQANAGLLDVHVLDRLSAHPALTKEVLLAVAAHNGRKDGRLADDLQKLTRDALFARAVELALLKIVVVISGQGPEAFGMPEMFAPMQHINANRALRKLAALISDGRFSGTSYGAAIGHVTPEALTGGGIGLLQTGDLLHIQLSGCRVDLLDPGALVSGSLLPWGIDLAEARRDLGVERRKRMVERQSRVSAINRLRNVSDASRGIVPLIVAA
jgi:dihydroxy-acid dehydratase